MTVSVIVPVYNVEHYLADCLASIRMQSHSDLEVVVVNDGSTDASGTICDEFAAQDPRFRVIHQANGGLSRARNVGIDQATGTHIVFIDGDDQVAGDHIASMFDAAQESGADIVMCGLVPFGDNPPQFQRTASTTMLTGREAALEFMCRRPQWSSCAKLYRAQIFDGLRFKPGILYEDLCIAPRFFARAETVVVLGGVSYGYRQRSDSIMARTQRAPSADLVAVVESNLALARQHSETPLELQEYVAAYSLHLTKQLERLGFDWSYQDAADFFRAYRRFGRQHFREVMTNRRISLAYRGAWALSVLSPRLFIWVFAAGALAKPSLVPGLSRSSGVL